MSQPGKEFDMRRFWGNIVPEDEDGSHRCALGHSKPPPLSSPSLRVSAVGLIPLVAARHLETSLETLEDVIDRTRTKVHRKRVVRVCGGGGGEEAAGCVYTESIPHAVTLACCAVRLGPAGAARRPQARRVPLQHAAAGEEAASDHAGRPHQPAAALRDALALQKHRQPAAGPPDQDVPGVRPGQGERACGRGGLAQTPPTGCRPSLHLRGPRCL